MLRRVDGAEDRPSLTADELLSRGEGTTAVDTDGDLVMVLDDRSAENNRIVHLTNGDKPGMLLVDASQYGPFTLCDIEVRRVG